MGVNIGLILIVTMLVTQATAQSDCSKMIISLTPCLGFATGTTKHPSGLCCAHLGHIVKSQPRCLCTLLNGGAGQLGATINDTLALELPEDCDVKIPDSNECNTDNAPAPSPQEPQTSLSPDPESFPGKESIAQGTAATLTVRRDLVHLFVIIAVAHASSLISF
ncbi:hypothetical protein ACFE04_012762 [Oxalis oulophora]